MPILVHIQDLYKNLDVIYVKIGWSEMCKLMQLGVTNQIVEDVLDSEVKIRHQLNDKVTMLIFD